MNAKSGARRKLATESLESRQLLHGGAFVGGEPPTAADVVERAFSRLDANEDQLITVDEVESERLWERISAADTDTAEGGDVSVSMEELTAHVEAQMAERADNSEMGPQRRGGRGHSGRGQVGPTRAGVGQSSADRLDQLFENDADGNGLTADEVSERVWGRISTADADTAEGEEVVVTREELEAHIEARRAERFDAAFARLDADGSGEVTESEVSERVWSRIVAADTDTADGAEVSISADELQSYKEARRAEREAPADTEEGDENGEGTEMAAQTESPFRARMNARRSGRAGRR